MSEHTPTPWQIYSEIDPHHIKIKGIRPDIGGAHIADVLFPANAAFIVKAVNSHDALVKALEEIKGGHFSDASSLAIEGNWKRMYEALQQTARATLESIKGTT